MDGKFLLAANMMQQQWPGVATVGLLCIPEVTGSQELVVGLLTIEPGDGFNFHRHPAQEEVLLVTEGMIEAWIERERKVLKPGDAMYLPRGIVHALFNTSATAMKMMAILGPASPGKPAGLDLVDVSGQAPWNTLR